MTQEKTDEDLLACALLTERIYFGLGAHERTGNGWIYASVPGLESLPAASVCLLEVEGHDLATIARTISDVEDAFAATRPSHARFYTGGEDPGFRALMENRGYRRRIEIVHAFAPLPGTADMKETASWRPVGSELDWKDKASIHAQPSIASDGYQAPAQDWVALERLKAETGKIGFWLFDLNGLPVATTGLIRASKDVVRIKNYFVRSDHRGRGVGKTALRSLLQQLPAAGEIAVVVLSVEDSIGQRLYASAGAREIGRIIEWSRTL